MAIQLTQVNALLAQRGKPAVTAEKLSDALDYAVGVYKVPFATINSETPAPQLVLGIALLATFAPFAQTPTAAVTSKEIKGNAGSIKTDYADAPVDAYPVVGGLLAPFTGKRTGVTFGVSSR